MAEAAPISVRSVGPWEGFRGAGKFLSRPERRPLSAVCGRQGTDRDAAGRCILPHRATRRASGPSGHRFNDQCRGEVPHRPRQPSQARRRRPLAFRGRIMAQRPGRPGAPRLSVKTETRKPPAKHRFGRWTVLAEAPPRYYGRHRNRYVLARCDCGTEREVRWYSLTGGGTKSCGCLTAYNQTSIRDDRTRIVHGMYGHPANQVWRDLIFRYGETGRFSPRWGTFPGFWQDMGPSWFAGAVLRRIDPARGYEPGNCHWVAPGPRRTKGPPARLIRTPWGPMTVTEAAARMGISRDVLWRRLRQDCPADLFRPAGIRRPATRP